MKDFAQKYLSILEEDYKGLNLTRILDFEEFYNKQILDALAPLEQSSVFQRSLEKVGAVFDVGFGGGFPLLCLAKCLPEKKFVGLEARGKKALAVSEIAKKLGLNNVKTHHQRLEMVLWDQPAILTFKAVGKIQEILPMINVKAPVEVFFYKGPNFREQDNYKNCLNEWEQIEEKQLEVPGVEARYFIGFASRNVPRGTKKNLVNCSSLI